MNDYERFEALVDGEKRAAGERCWNDGSGGAGGRGDVGPSRTGVGATFELPQVIVDAGPDAVARGPGVLRKADRERADESGVREGLWGSLSGGARRGASASPVTLAAALAARLPVTGLRGSRANGKLAAHGERPRRESWCLDHVP